MPATLDGPPRKKRMQFDSDLGQLEAVRRSVRDFCSAIPSACISPERLDQAVLGVNEAVANIMRHAYSGEVGRPITMEMSTDDRVLRMVLADCGSPFAPENVPPAALDGSRDSGFGVFIIRQCFDRVDYRRSRDGRNLLELVVHLDPLRDGVS